MKTIFLDIDGVIATDRQFMGNRNKFNQKNPWSKELRVPYGFDKGCVAILNEILEETSSVIVMSSDWRTHWNLTELNEIFSHNGIIRGPKFVTDVDPVSFGNLEKNRAWEIEKFIKEHDITNYVVIDDLDVGKYMSESGDDNKFVKTVSSEGLKQTGIKNKILSILNK